MKRNNNQVLPETLELAGKWVIDVGCGDGALVRLMTRHGARVSGIECSREMLTTARAAEPAGEETYLEGVGERLPFAEASVDIVVYFNSLHHVAVESQPEALREAARVLVPGGLLYVSEPLAEGPHFRLMKPVIDETRVRARAYRALAEAPDDAGLVEVREFSYVHPARHRDYEAFRDQVCAINPQCRAVFEELDAEMRSAFERLGRKTEKGVEFDQPMRVNLLRRG